MQAEKSPEDEFFYEMTQDGEVHKVSVTTGEVVNKARDIEEILLENAALAPYNANGVVKRWNYRPEWAEIIASHLAAGKTLASFYELPGTPSVAVVARWRAEHRELEEAIRVGRRMRAESRFDEIITDHEKQGILAKEEVAGAKLRLERQKYLAKIDDPERYGERSGDSSGGAGVTIIVDTGFKDNAKTIEGECYETTSIGREREVGGDGIHQGREQESIEAEARSYSDASGDESPARERSVEGEDSSGAKGFRLNGDEQT